jgi:CDP-ribitol ribitolphosphotransferase
VRRLLVAVRIALVRAGFALGRLRPIRRRVVLATSHAEAIGGNLACIRDELVRRSPPVEVAVLAYRPARGIRSKLAAMVHAVRAGHHLATARLVVVDDYFFPLYVIRPRPGTRRVQVWHASGAFKKFGYSVLEKSFGADEATVSRVAIHSNYDLCLVSSMSVAPFYAEAFRQPLERFTSRLGIPRTDVLLGQDASARATEVRRRYRLPVGRRTILYAPTFRGNRVTDARFESHLDLAVLRDMIGGDSVVLLRLHPFVRAGAALPHDLGDFVVDVSDHPDIHELMLASDVLVTDYSSAIYEFSLLGRPILFHAPDHAAYERERGFYLDYRTGLPGPIFETTEALGAALRAGVFDSARVEAFARASFDVADGRSTARFVDAVVLAALAGRPPALEVSRPAP